MIIYSAITCNFSFTETCLSEAFCKSETVFWALFNCDSVSDLAFSLRFNWSKSLVTSITLPKIGRNNIISDISKEVKFMTIYEDYVLKKVKKGSSIRGLYPLTNEDEKNNFEAWLSTQG